MQQGQRALMIQHAELAREYPVLLQQSRLLLELLSEVTASRDTASAVPCAASSDFLGPPQDSGLCELGADSRMPPPPPGEAARSAPASVPLASAPPPSLI